MRIRVAIYARTSPDCPLSADDQVQRLKTVAAERGWTGRQIFTDRPTSARGPDRRPGEAALIDAIRNGADRSGVHLVDLPDREIACRSGRRFMETCRTAGVALWIDEQRIDTETSNGMSLFDFGEMMALHVRQCRRDRILRGQAAARSLSIRFGRPSNSDSQDREGQAHSWRWAREFARWRGWPVGSARHPCRGSRHPCVQRPQSDAEGCICLQYPMNRSGRAGEIRSAK